ncbi:hypothetical protein LPJ59_000657 [Coemansia sp. RSA 2399]|nr:hypothetical protein LPJ59_000657 [Coemansia sp. RSA 2399]
MDKNRQTQQSPHNDDIDRHGAGSEHKGKERAGSSHANDPAPSRNQDRGVLHQMASSASRLARSVASSNPAAVDLDALSEAKSGQTEGAFSMTREWFAENGYKHAQDPTESISLAGSSGSSAAFRQAARTTSAQRISPPGGFNRENTSLRHSGDIPTDMAFTDRPTQSHQVKLAEHLDGHGVVEFLSQKTPTSMSTGGISVLASSLSGSSAQGQNIQALSSANPADPVSYLQGATYTTDMEALDHHVPRETQGQTASTSAPSASPAGLAKAWDEHSASILEEWELNEAWDRAWMDTTWSSVQKKEKPADEKVPTADPVLPSNKNLSYLLKPRI